MKIGILLLNFQILYYGTKTKKNNIQKEQQWFKHAFSIASYNFIKKVSISMKQACT